MYATRGPSKLSSLPQVRCTKLQFADFEGKEGALRDPLGLAAMSSQKAVFNGRRPINRSMPSQVITPVENSAPQHDENVRFVLDSWQRVQNDLKNPNKEVEIYKDMSPNTLTAFEPIDLDQFFANRLYEQAKQAT